MSEERESTVDLLETLKGVLSALLLQRDLDAEDVDRLMAMDMDIEEMRRKYEERRGQG